MAYLHNPKGLQLADGFADLGRKTGAWLQLPKGDVLEKSLKRAMGTI
jgi:hypothetical protein